MNFNEDGITRLCAAVCGKAAEDYRYLRRTHQNRLESDSRVTLEEIQNFFEGDLFPLYAGARLDGKSIFAKLKAEMDEELGE